MTVSSFFGAFVASGIIHNDAPPPEDSSNEVVAQKELTPETEGVEEDAEPEDVRHSSSLCQLVGLIPYLAGTLNPRRMREDHGLRSFGPSLRALHRESHFRTRISPRGLCRRAL